MCRPVRPGFPVHDENNFVYLRRTQPWHCSWTLTLLMARSRSTTWRRRTPPTCRPRTPTTFGTCGTGSTRSTARSSAWSTRRTPTLRRRCTVRRTDSSPTRSTRSPRAPDPGPHRSRAGPGQLAGARVLTESAREADGVHEGSPADVVGGGHEHLALGHRQRCSEVVLVGTELHEL